MLSRADFIFLALKIAVVVICKNCRVQQKALLVN